MILPGILALSGLGLLIFGSLGAVLWRAGGFGEGIGPADMAIIRFTLLQATLSAGISVALAVPLARALARLAFPGRRLLVALLGAPFILPVIVAVFGILGVWGRSGWISDLFLQVGLPRVDIYGLSGVVLAHVFFNLPLVTRLILLGWSAIPPEQFRLAAQLGFTRADRFRHLEGPMLRRVVPGAFLVVFLLAMASFAVVLTLGGGPKATSVELAIFTAIRFEYDLGRAALLAVLQVGLAGIFATILLIAGRPTGITAGSIGAGPVFCDHTTWRYDGALIILATAFLLTPILAVILRGLPALTDVFDARLAEALGLSLAIAAVSTSIALGGALVIAALAVRVRTGWLTEALAMLVLVASPFVLGTGLFLLIQPLADPFRLALPVTALINGALTLPFCLRIIYPAWSRLDQTHGALAASLGITGPSFFRLVLWPGLKAPIGFAAGLSAALSMGDLGVITLFAPVDQATLPLLIYRLMGAYRMDQAAAVALILTVTSIALFLLIEKGTRLGRHLS